MGSEMCIRDRNKDVLGYGYLSDAAHRIMWSYTSCHGLLTASDSKSQSSDIAFKPNIPDMPVSDSEVSAQKHHTQLADGMDDSHCPVPYRRIFPELCRGNDNCGIIFADKIHIKI